MIIGIPKEIKNKEFRVGLIPSAVSVLSKAGHTILVEKGAGDGSGYNDAHYLSSGAIILDNPDDVWEKSDMIIKVKEPLESEYKYLRDDLILFTYLHLASNYKLTKVLLDSKTTAIAYETIKDQKGELPCLIPMSNIAGRMAIQEGCKYLERAYGGRGILLSGVNGSPKGEVLIFGAGHVGTAALDQSVRIGANVTILDVDQTKLSNLKNLYGNKIQALVSNRKNAVKSLSKADLVVGAVLGKPGQKTPNVIKKEDLVLMKKGALIVDVAIDQGGCCETSRATTHDDPIYCVDGIIHYCVGNIPGAVPRTASEALGSATLQYALELANRGLKAFEDNASLKEGLNCYQGKCLSESVAEAFGIK